MGFVLGKWGDMSLGFFVDYFSKKVKDFGIYDAGVTELARLKAGTIAKDKHLAIHFR